MVVVEAHRAQRVPLGRLAEVKLRAPVPGQLHGGQADAAGSGVDQDPLARLDVGQFDERVVRRGEHGERGGGLGIGPPGRHWQQQSGVA